MKKSLIQILYFVLLAGLLPAEEIEKVPSKDIRDVISSKEFKLSGLNKLSSEELMELSGALYGWKELQRPKQTLLPAQEKVTVREEQAFGNESLPVRKPKAGEKPKPQKISTRIVGDFKGWKGNTVFELDNGQVWRQADKSRFSAREENPEVEITKGFLGVYFLSIQGYGARCKVKRVR